MSYWGFHLILDCKSCDIDKIVDRANIDKFVKELVERIDMKAFGEPTIEHFAAHDPDAAGYSLVQLIETSSITGHFVDKNGDAYIDIFSCKSFEPDTALEVVDEFFCPHRVRVLYMIRDARDEALDQSATVRRYTWVSAKKPSE